METATDGMLRQPVDIKFSSQSLSYAERLMLKKHRRMELGALPGTSSPSSFAVAADKTMTNDHDIMDRQDRLHRLSDENVFQWERADAVSEDGRLSRLSDGDSESRSHREALGGFLASSRSQLKSSFVADSSRPQSDLGKTSLGNRKGILGRISAEPNSTHSCTTICFTFLLLVSFSFGFCLRTHLITLVSGTNMLSLYLLPEPATRIMEDVF